MPHLPMHRIATSRSLAGEPDMVGTIAANLRPSTKHLDFALAAWNSTALTTSHQVPLTKTHRDELGSRTETGVVLAGVGHIFEKSCPSMVVRQIWAGHGVTVESVRCTGPEPIVYRFRAPQHLLVLYEQCERTRGETIVEGARSSTLRNLTGKLTIVPVGHEFCERHELRADAQITFFHFDTALLPRTANVQFGEILIKPRLLFEDVTLSSTAKRLNMLFADGTSPCGERYTEALGVVLAHDFVRFNNAAPIDGPLLKGGLASWQQRIVTVYLREHFARQIPLAKLARLVGLSSCHFSRAFKKSFGLPPQRYQSARRIEQAKLLLGMREMSVTDIGLEVGFTSSSAFASSFRKATGMSPSAYARTVNR